MTAEIIYKGKLHSELRHLQSGTIIGNDAPTDNHGTGASFSPTDMVATAAGSCALSIMGIACLTHGMSIEGTRVTVQKVMTASPRRIAEIHLDFYFPANKYSDKEKKILENAAHTCPVMLSLSPDVNRVLNFHYQE